MTNRKVFHVADNLEEVPTSNYILPRLCKVKSGDREITSGGIFNMFFCVQRGFPHRCLIIVTMYPRNKISREL